jgi:hypothetical protein
MRQIADGFDKEAAEALRAGRKEEALRLFAAAEAMRERAEERDRVKRLPPRVNKRTVNSVLSTDHKVAISKGRTAAKNKLAAAARASGMSMRDLAKKVGVSVALLSMAAAGTRSLKRSVAEHVEKLTGYRVSNWPTLS